MQVSVETTSGLERKMTVEVPAENIDSAVNERLQSLAKTAKMNGFRPGKVPMRVVRKRFEPQVRGEILGDVINRSFYDAVAQEKLRPAGQPLIEPVSEPDQKDFSYTAVFEVYPEFEPVFDHSISIDQPVVEVADSDIDEMLESLRKQRTEYESVDRAAVLEDQVVIDFVGSIEGVEFEGGKAEEAPLVLGSGAMIAGFEDQLVGVVADEKKTIEVTFPEDYGSDQLAGKQASFAITVHSVKEPRVPEMTEELVKSFGIEDGQLEGLRADISKNMNRELKQRVDAQVKQQVMDGLLKLNDVEVPKALSQQEISRLRDQLAQQMPPEKNADQNGDPSGETADAPSGAYDSERFPDELFTEEANRRVRLGLVIGEIVRHRKIEADEAAVRAQIETMASSYQEPQAVVDYYMSDPELRQNVENLVLEEAVIQTILESATVKEQKMSFQEIMNPPAAQQDNPA